MTEKFQFAWIDDTPERARDYIGALAVTLRGEAVDADLEVFPIQDGFINDVSKRAGEWSASPPSLIMIDHSFTKVDHRAFNIQGSALAHLLRLQLPTIPMVCVSGQNFDTDDFSVEDISEYTYMFPITTLNDEGCLETLFAIAKDFPLFQFPEKQGVRNLLVEALLAPEADKQALRSVLPEEFEETFKHSTSPHRLARWVLNVLMSRPGFLSDPLEVATMLGLTEKAFTEKASEHFETALYRGPFATSRKPLWWTTSIADVLYEVLPGEAALLPNEAGRRLPGIEEADYSICAVSGEVSPPPDVVAYTDATASTRQAVRNVYTEPLSEEASSLLGFSTRLKIRNTRRRG